MRFFPFGSTRPSGFWKPAAWRWNQTIAVIVASMSFHSLVVYARSKGLSGFILASEAMNPFNSIQWRVRPSHRSSLPDTARIGRRAEGMKPIVVERFPNSVIDLPVKIFDGQPPSCRTLSSPERPLRAAFPRRSLSSDLKYELHAHLHTARVGRCRDPGDLCVV